MELDLEQSAPDAVDHGEASTPDPVVAALRVARRWATSASYVEVSCNPRAHQRGNDGVGPHHLVVKRGRGVVNVEVSTWNGETQIRSEIERLLRRLDIPRSTDERPWPSGKQCVVVPLAVAVAILSKSHPRRCAYWVLAESEDHFLFEVLPVIESPGADEASSASSDGHHSAREWDGYWARRTHGTLAHHDRFPLSDAVFLRYLFAQDRPDLHTRDARILCVGNGVSALPDALAAAGFPVTVLELSRVAIDTCRDKSPTRAELDEFFELARIELGLDNASSLYQPNGSTVWVQGDLFDADVCPGDYDLIVVSRCLDSFNEFDLRVAVGRLDARLDDDGWCWVVVQNSGFRWIDVQREFRAIGYAIVPYAHLPPHGKAMAGGLTSA